VVGLASPRFAWLVFVGGIFGLPYRAKPSNAPHSIALLSIGKTLGLPWSALQSGAWRGGAEPSEAVHGCFKLNAYGGILGMVCLALLCDAVHLRAVPYSAMLNYTLLSSATKII
jgi:hypothetical protein